MIILSRFSFLAVLAMLVTLNGCSFSESSKSSSQSVSESIKSSSKFVSSPFTSSSDSSKGESSYQDEVIDYTSAYAKSSDGDVASFRSGLAGIASKNGVVNWEVDQNTYIAIGKGLKKANLSDIEYETFKKNLADSDYGKMQDIQKGFDSQ